MVDTSENWLHKNLENQLGRGPISEIELPKEILNNLNQKIELRDYQKRAFQNAIAYFEKYPFKKMPSQVLFNMATGSGKTLIMAGLILYFFKKGYNNFLFFVNSNNVIAKTKNNFLNPSHMKFLFNEKITFGGREVSIKEASNFTGTNKDEINVCFTTIHKLHNDLNLDRENSITLNYFRDKKIVLISDEAHHGQAKTRQKTLDEEKNWETTVGKIFGQNEKNVLLEFTATMGIDKDKDIRKKYRDKLLFNYDLIDFRNDGFSKEPEIFRVDGDKKYRILTAVLVNQYRQDVAQRFASIYLNSEKLTDFKPVILFKATKTIDDSMQNQKLFNELIQNLTKKDLEDVRDRSDNPVIKKLFDFYKNEKISLNNLIRHKLKPNFSKERCMNVNEGNLDRKSIRKEDEKELINQQELLNSLEDGNNKIRVIFAVEKLNEGWDVLNLYDIVRISDRQSSGGGVSGGLAKATISEAQLVGRGVRYFPFRLEPSENMNSRKYDEKEHDLKILEELYFHCHPGDGGRYVAELRKAFEEEGLGETGLEDKELKIKESFKKNPFYKTAKIYLNRQIPRDTSKETSFSYSEHTGGNMVHEIYSGKGEMSSALNHEERGDSKINKKTSSVKVSCIEPHVVKNALTKVFEFGNKNKGMKKYFPKISSMDDVLHWDFKDEEIDFRGTEEDLNNLSSREKLVALIGLLEKIKEIITENYSEYEGSREFSAKKAFGKDSDKPVFHDKTIRVRKNSERDSGDCEYLKDKDWCVFDSNYGTDQEKYCVKFIGELIEKKKLEKFREIYLVRNELHFKIYDFEDGRAFSPDFVLFMKSGDGEEITYQIFIEPKGSQFRGADGTFREGKEGWKEQFLKEIKENFRTEDLTGFEDGDFRLLGLRFYNNENRKEFEEDFFESLK